MTAEGKYKKAWVYSLIALCLMPATFLLMPIAAKMSSSSKKWPLIVVGMVFWVSLISGIVTFVIAAIKRKKEYPIKGESVGFLGFFGNVKLSYIDTVFIMSVIWLVVNIVSKNTSNYAIYINIFLLIVSFDLHCLFSSNLYRYIINGEKESERL